MPESKAEFNLHGSCGTVTGDERWRMLETWIKGYILFDKIDRKSGNEVLMLMEELNSEGIKE